jgi:hypothetical protein
MSDTAAVSLTGSVTIHAGPAASTEYIMPVISPQVNTIDAPVFGLVPIFPVIADGGTLVIPVFERITKFAAEPRSTAPDPVVTGQVLGLDPPPSPLPPPHPARIIKNALTIDTNTR